MIINFLALQRRSERVFEYLKSFITQEIASIYSIDDLVYSDPVYCQRKTYILHIHHPPKKIKLS
jgi:hypothetical protein